MLGRNWKNGKIDCLCCKDLHVLKKWKFEGELFYVAFYSVKNRPYKRSRFLQGDDKLLMIFTFHVFLLLLSFGFFIMK